MDNDDCQLTLENLMIAAPCDVEWDDMVGDERTRRCHDCKLNVYNVTSLTRKEVEELMQISQAKGQRLCMQLYRRADGTIITADCPQGLKKVRAFAGRAWRWVAAALALAVGGSGAMADDKAKTPAVPVDSKGKALYRTAGLICPIPKNKSGEAETKKTADQSKTGAGESKAGEETKTGTAEPEETHKGKAHYTAFNLYKEGQQYEKAGTWAKAVEVYQEALTLMAKQKHDPKFHLKIETALSRAKAKAGMNQ